MAVARRRQSSLYWVSGAVVEPSTLLLTTVLLIASTPYVSSQGPLPNVDNYIVTDSYMRNIYQVDATTGATHKLLPLGTAYNPIALAYDSTARMLYWTDVIVKTVNRYSMVTNTSVMIYRDPFNIGVYDGLAIDTGRHKLYLADAAQSGGKVAEISTDGTGYRVLFSSNSSNSSQPRALVLHNDNRTLYWTDWSTNSPGIYRSSVVNPARETLVTDLLHWPNALAIDFTAGVMYWGDAGLHKIESANLDGTGRRILLTETRAHYFAFQFHAGSIYFTDWTSRYIRRLNIATRTTSMIASATSFVRANGIVFMADTRSTSAPVTVKSTTATTTTSTTTSTTSTTSKPAPATQTASATSKSTTKTTTPTAQSTTSKTSTTSSHSTANPQGSNPEPSNTISETTIIILTVCVVGGIVVVVIVIAVAIIACRCARRTRQTPSQPVNRPAQKPQEPQVVYTVYDEPDVYAQTNDMYIHPHYSRTPAASFTPYQDLDEATMNAAANSGPYQYLDQATM